MCRRVVLADDHNIVRQAVKSMLRCQGYDIIGEACNGQEALRQCRDLQPDIVVLDVSMPMLNGIEAAREIMRLCPDTKVVVLTVHTEDQAVVEGLRAGVKAYVSKSNTAKELICAMQAVCRGEIYLDSRVSPGVLEEFRRSTRAVAEPLGIRERQVLQLIAEGKSVKEIAQVLGISYKTVQSHRANIMNKLGVQSTAILVRYAISCGLTEV